MWDSGGVGASNPPKWLRRPAHGFHPRLPPVRTACPLHRAAAGVGTASGGIPSGGDQEDCTVARLCSFRKSQPGKTATLCNTVHKHRIKHPKPCIPPTTPRRAEGPAPTTKAEPPTTTTLPPLQQNHKLTTPTPTTAPTSPAPAAPPDAAAPPPTAEASTLPTPRACPLPGTPTRIRGIRL